MPVLLYSGFKVFLLYVFLKFPSILDFYCSIIFSTIFFVIFVFGFRSDSELIDIVSGSFFLIEYPSSLPYTCIGLANFLVSYAISF